MVVQEFVVDLDKPLVFQLSNAVHDPESSLTELHMYLRSAIWVVEGSREIPLESSLLCPEQRFWHHLIVLGSGILSRSLKPNKPRKKLGIV